MYFQMVDNRVLSTQGQPDVFNLHRLTTFPSGKVEPHNVVQILRAARRDVPHVR